MWQKYDTNCIIQHFLIVSSENLRQFWCALVILNYAKNTSLIVLVGYGVKKGCAECKMSTPTIAIVEDDTNIRNLVESYLLKEGYETIGLVSAEEAEDLWRKDPPDLWVLDIMLPGMDGYEFCQRLRKKSENPVIMISALDEEMSRIKGIKLGSDDYLTKPFNPQELVARVNRLLYRWRMFSKHEEVLSKGPSQNTGETSVPGLQIFLKTNTGWFGKEAKLR